MRFSWINDLEGRLLWKNACARAYKTLNAIEKVLGFTLVAFGIVENDVLRFRQFRGIDILGPIELSLTDPGITVRVVKTGETQLVKDVGADKDHAIAVTGTENLPLSLSELAVPIKVGTEVVAVIDVESIYLDAFTLEDRRLLETFAEHVSTSISRLKQEKKIQTSLEKLNASARAFYTIFQNAPICMVLVDRERQVQRLNQTTIEFLSRPAKELIGLRQGEALGARANRKTEQLYIY